MTKSHESTLRGFLINVTTYSHLLQVWRRNAIKVFGFSLHLSCRIGKILWSGSFSKFLNKSLLLRDGFVDPKFFKKNVDAKNTFKVTLHMYNPLTAQPAVLSTTFLQRMIHDSTFSIFFISRSILYLHPTPGETKLVKNGVDKKNSVKKGKFKSKMMLQWWMNAFEFSDRSSLLLKVSTASAWWKLVKITEYFVTSSAYANWIFMKNFSAQLAARAI